DAPRAAARRSSRSNPSIVGSENDGGEYSDRIGLRAIGSTTPGCGAGVGHGDSRSATGDGGSGACAMTRGADRGGTISVRADGGGTICVGACDSGAQGFGAAVGSTNGSSNAGASYDDDGA